MPPGNSMAQMIQMLSVLSDIKDRRAQMDQQKVQFEEQKKQWAAQFGLNQDVHNINKFTKAFELIADGTAKPEDYQLVSTALNLPPEQAQALKIMGPNANTFLQQIQAKGQQQMQGYVAEGVNSYNPAQRQGVMQNAAARSLTGQGMGELAQGNLTQLMAGNFDPQAAYGAQMMGDLARGFAIQQATRQTPDQYATGQYAVNTPGYIPSAARIAAGMDPTAGQSMSDRLGWYQANTQQIQGAQQLGLQAFIARNSGQGGPGGGGGGFNPVSAAAELRQQLASMSKSKDTNELTRLAGLYNSLAAMTGWKPLKDLSEVPNALGLLDKFIQGSPTGPVQQFLPPAGNPPPGRGPGGGQPYQPPAPPPYPYQPPRY